MCQTRNGYLHNEGKAESILLSEVVQRYAGDKKVIRFQAPLTKHISQFRRTTKDHVYINLFSFWQNNLFTERKSERAIY